MDITYPLFGLPDSGTGSSMLAGALYTNNEGGSSGFFAAGIDHFWHGGVHLCARSTPIRAIADGEVIAYRMNSALQEADLGDGQPARKFSSGFVLIKHELTTPKAGKIPFFSLYMHLKPMTSAETEQESAVNEAPHIFKKTQYVVADNRHGSGLPVIDADASELKGIIPFGAHFTVHPNDDKCKKERYRKIKLVSARASGYVMVDASKLSRLKIPTPQMPGAKGRILTAEALPSLPGIVDTLPILDGNLRPTGKTIPKNGFFVLEDAPNPYAAMRYEKVVWLRPETSTGFIENFAASAVRISGEYYRMTGDKSLWAPASGTTIGEVTKDTYVRVVEERLPATHWTRVTPNNTKRFTQVKVFTNAVTGFAMIESNRSASVKTSGRNQTIAVLDAAGQQAATIEAQQVFLALGERPAAGSALKPLVVRKVSYPDPSVADRIEGYAFLRTGYDYMKLDQSSNDTGNLHLWGDAAMTAAWENELIDENRQVVRAGKLQVDQVFELLEDSAIPAGHWSLTTGWRKVSFTYKEKQGQAEHKIEGYAFVGSHTTVEPASAALTPNVDQTFKLVNAHRLADQKIKDQPPRNATIRYRAGGRTSDFLAHEKRASTYAAYPWDGKYDGVNVHALADDKSEVLTVLEMGTTVKLTQAVPFQIQLQEGHHVWVPTAKKIWELSDGGFIFVDGVQVTKRAELPRPIEFDKVVALSTPIPIKRGDIVGFPGQMDGGEDSFHFEVFMADHAFTGNPCLDRWGASLARIDPGTSFRVRKPKASTATDSVSLPGPCLVTIVEKDFSWKSEPGGSVLFKLKGAPMLGWIASSDIDAATGKLAKDVSVLYRELIGVPRTVQRTVRGRDGRDRVVEERVTVQQVKTTGSRYAMTGKKEQVVRVLETRGEAVHIEFTEDQSGWIKQSDFDPHAKNLGEDENHVYLYELNHDVTLLKDNPARSYEFSAPSAEEKESLKSKVAALPRKQVEGKDWIELTGKDVETVSALDGKLWAGVKVDSTQHVWFEASAVKRLYPGYDWLDWQFFQESEQRDDPATREVAESSFSKDGFCDIRALLDIIGATNRAESFPKLRRFGCAHPTEWDYQTDAALNKWERLKYAPWRYRDDRYTKVLEYIKAFQWWDSVPGLPAADQVWHIHPIGFIEHMRGMPLINAEQLIAIFGSRDATRLKSLVEPLCDSLERYDITTPYRIAHFLAQTGAETGVYFFNEEQTDGAAYEHRTDLGNGYRGDGRNFIGRGFIQLTGRSNYEAYERYLGEDITSSRGNAEKVASMRLAIDSAGWFWSTHRLNAIADNSGREPDAKVVERISTIINGGCNGRGVRLHFFKRARRVLCRDIDS